VAGGSNKKEWGGGSEEKCQGPYWTDTIQGLRSLLKARGSKILRGKIQKQSCSRLQTLFAGSVAETEGRTKINNHGNRGSRRSSEKHRTKVVSGFLWLQKAVSRNTNGRKYLNSLVAKTTHCGMVHSQTALRGDIHSAKSPRNKS